MSTVPLPPLAAAATSAVPPLAISVPPLNITVPLERLPDGRETDAIVSRFDTETAKAAQAAIFARLGRRLMSRR